MKHTYLRTWATALLVLVGSLAYAQAPAWKAVSAANNINSTLSGVTAVAADGNGNIYLAGTLNGSVYFGSVLAGPQGGPDAYVAKWSTATNSFVWVLVAGGVSYDFATSVAVSGSSVYVGGTFGSATATFGTTTLTNSSPGAGQNGFIAKITDAGSSASFGWAVPVGGNSSATVKALAVSGSNVYATGDFGGSSASIGPFTLPNSNTVGSYNDLYVAKLVDAGTSATVAWVQHPTGPNQATEEPSCLAVSGSSVYVAGFCTGATAFGSTTLAAPVRLGGFVAKVVDAGSSSSFAWVQAVGGAAETFPYGVVARGTDVYVAGLFQGAAAATFGSTTLAQPAGSPSWASEAFVTKLSDAGAAPTFSWALQAGGTGRDSANALLAVGSSLYVAGRFNSPTATFGATTLANASASPASTGHTSDLYVARIAEAGSGASFAWAQQAGGPNNDVVAGLAASGTTLYAAGYVGGDASFGSLAVAPRRAPYERVGYLAAFDSQAALAAAPATALPGLALYPNPAHGTTTVRVPADSPATLTLLDALGRVARTCVAPADQGYPLDVSDLAPGVYALRVQAGGAQATHKLVVE